MSEPTRIAAKAERLNKNYQRKIVNEQFEDRLRESVSRGDVIPGHMLGVDGNPLPRFRDAVARINARRRVVERDEGMFLAHATARKP